jgi:hypothetical protein
MGSKHLESLANALNSQQPNRGDVWTQALLAFVGVAGPIWLAWLSTKQIGQRFRLAEDYAFKASVAKAYEGYRKEAARLDVKLEARLFSSALTRLEEAPLRLVEGKTPGSPWHELFESEAFREALKVIPGLRDQFRKARKKSAKTGATSGEEVLAIEPDDSDPKK